MVGLLLLALPSGSRAYVEVVMSPSLAPFSLSSSSSPHTHTRLRGARTAQCAQRERKETVSWKRARAAAAAPIDQWGASPTLSPPTQVSLPLSDMEAFCVSVAKIEVSDPAYMDNKARFYTFGTGHVYRQYTSNGFFAEHSRSACYLRYESRG